jgi:SPP1 gp7 family putative phage head morphogenesis protein
MGTYKKWVLKLYSKEERDLIYKQARELILSMQEAGRPVPEVIKRRDRNEPYAELKERMEDRFAAVCKRHWRIQREIILQRMQLLTGRKALPPEFNFDIFGEEDEEFEAALLRLILYGMTEGINGVSNTINIGLDYTLINKHALVSAGVHAKELKKSIDAATMDYVKAALEQFIQTPGFTMGDLTNLLEPTFGEVRARRIAVTETTRSYAQGQIEAGKELKKHFPDIKVVKIWFTNADDRVCEICGPLNGAEVELDELFEGEIPEPPAHVNCRCWMDTRTRING